MYTAVLYSLSLLTTVVAFKNGFIPDNRSFLPNNLVTLPTAYNVSTSLTRNDEYVPGSYWTTFFIHGSDDHDYMLHSHVMFIGQIVPYASFVYRASVVDITDTSRFSQFEGFSNTSNVYDDSGLLNATFPGLGFEDLGSEGGTPALRTWSDVSGFEFDLTFELSSPVLLNGGLGSWQGARSTVHEWGMPAGRTYGWLALNGSRVTVDEEKSLTWFDRQRNGAPQAWTWFQFQLDSEEPNGVATPMSIWCYNTTAGPGGHATIRELSGTQRVVPVVSLQPSDRTYTSAATGIVYPLDWVLSLGDGSTFNMSSVRPDQELYGPGGAFPTYEGVITITGEDADGRELNGYGVAEMYDEATA